MAAGDADASGFFEESIMGPAGAPVPAQMRIADDNGTDTEHVERRRGAAPVPAVLRRDGGIDAAMGRQLTDTYRPASFP